MKKLKKILFSLIDKIDIIKKELSIYIEFNSKYFNRLKKTFTFIWWNNALNEQLTRLKHLKRDASVF